MKTDSTASKTKAISIAKKVAVFLRKRGASKVILFGSLVTDDYHRESSDIDIYFEGIDYEEECRVAGEAMTAFREVELDIIPAGHCRTSFIKLVEEEGRELLPPGS
jgi:predicted nucleotidyltransferase